jgi:hypothetical protein
LIKQGAYLFEESDDVLNALNERNIVQKDLLAYKCSNDISKIGDTKKFSDKDLDKIK